MGSSINPTKASGPLSINPFHVLRRSDSRDLAISQDEPSTCQCEVRKEEEKNNDSSRDPPSLQIADDRLSEMFELLQETQVVRSAMGNHLLADHGFSRHLMICWLP